MYYSPHHKPNLREKNNRQISTLEGNLTARRNNSWQNLERAHYQPANIEMSCLSTCQQPTIIKVDKGRNQGQFNSQQTSKQLGKLSPGRLISPPAEI
jgi:hypothetical protein